MLLAAGHSVTAWVRDPQRASAHFNGRVTCIGSLGALDGNQPPQVVINQAGAPIASQLWTAARKAVLLQSRVGTTGQLARWFAESGTRPEVWIQASAIGFYGVRPPEEALDESSTIGVGFMAELCQQWEESARAGLPQGTRLVTLRLGVVLGQGGALPLLLRPIRLGVGGRLGSGRQILSWIHLEDVLRLMAEAMGKASMQGTYNAVAPGAVAQAQFVRTAGRLLHRPVWLPIPQAPVRWLAGEMAELFVDGQWVVPRRLFDAGFTFSYPGLEMALRNLTS